MSGIFGTFVTPTLVEQAVQAQIRKYINAYLGAVEAAEGYPLGRVQRPKTWFVRSEWPEDIVPTCPAIAILSPGVAEQRRNHGLVIGRWDIRVAAITAGAGHGEGASDHTSRMYGAALGLLFTHLPALAENIVCLPVGPVSYVDGSTRKSEQVSWATLRLQVDAPIYDTEPSFAPGWDPADGQLPDGSWPTPASPDDQVTATAVDIDLVEST
jgi:hypothetical protein